MAESRPKSQAAELAPGDAAPWQDLPRELLTRILAQLPTNEVPCTARLVCKPAAAALSSPQHTTVRLSQPSPHGEFVRRWGAPGAMRPLTRDRRHRLLCLTAASGCLTNLACLVERIGCVPDTKVHEAAAAAGRPEACRWLQQQGYDGLSAALAAAAGAGQRSTFEALLAAPGAQSPPSRLRQNFDARLAANAARGGHVGLMDWVLERFETCGLPDERKTWAGWELLSAAAAGCDLATLQRLHLAHQPQLTQLEQNQPGHLRRLLGRAAASSRTPDWKAKVEWVEACLGAPLDDTIACAKAAACPDALERLTWLRARGCPLDWRAVTSAAHVGNAEALSYLLAGGCEVQFSAFRAAAEEGHLAALEVLHSYGLAATNPGEWFFVGPRGLSWTDVAAVATRKGQLPVVRWMLERQLLELQPPARQDRRFSLLGYAAESGSVELLALLRAGGCRWGEIDLCAAARGGSEEALEWAVAQGCPVQEPSNEDDDPYLIAARQGDWGTLACLRRLAVPWRPLSEEDDTFTDAVQAGCSVPILRRLLELGCPVDWARAEEAAEDREDDEAEVRAWLVAREALTKRRWERAAAAVGRGLGEVQPGQ